MQSSLHHQHSRHGQGGMHHGHHVIRHPLIDDHPIISEGCMKSILKGERTIANAEHEALLDSVKAIQRFLSLGEELESSGIKICVAAKKVCKDCKKVLASSAS